MGASLVGLSDYAERSPGELSGGQQQASRPGSSHCRQAAPAADGRAAFQPRQGTARAWPGDSRPDRGAPLDRGVRHTRSAARSFALADRVVLQHGCLQQIDTPEALFHTPATPEVADSWMPAPY
ncbi:hypothetical protein DSL92_03135 [Billgrantia gudaonensis]|uniref:Uncharacterized protein n=1 Tax=Billgrantia gudaonensis TaxID=376427 RepID=A0A3S0NHJ3_9GAMM|nr:hypothetical protein DSL92_03135 [Halomonas gudaonensis]